MTTLVIGGTGKVGALLLRLLLARGAAVRVLTRSAERAATLPHGAEGMVADITADPDGARVAFAGVDAVYMLNRPTPEETVEGLLAVELARAMGVRRFVFQSIHKAEAMAHIPHVASKLAIERGVVGSGMGWTLLRPNYFFQNDLTAKAGLEAGLYTAPVGSVGVAAVDAGDIAQAAAVALLEDGHEGQRYDLVGPELLTGEHCAAVWSAVLGREVRYAGDVEGWRAATCAVMPAWFNFDLAMMYRHLACHGMPSDPGEVARMSALIGRPPRAYRDYVAEQARAWGMAA